VVALGVIALSVLWSNGCDSRRPTDQFADSTTSSANPIANKQASADAPEVAPINPGTPAPHQDILAATSLPEDFELMFNHDGSCLRCIDYRVHMYADGNAVFRNTQTEVMHPEVGPLVLPAVKAQRDMDPDVMLNLAKTLGRIGFLDIEQEDVAEPCELDPGHRPLVTFKLTWNGRSNIIKHDHRCNPRNRNGLQKALLDAENQIRRQTKLGEYLDRLRETAASKQQAP
jgi:hypothetical protein